MPTTLEDLSSEMQISPSGLRKRIHALGLPVEKGSRGRWCIPDDLLDTLREADRLMKDGAGAATTRRVLGLDGDRPSAPGREGAERAPSPDLQQALAMLSAERERSDQLQSRVNSLMSRVAELTGACAMYQERTKHLTTALQALQPKEVVAAPEQEPGKLRSWWEGRSRRKDEE